MKCYDLRDSMYILRLIVRVVYVARLEREAAVGDVDLEEV